MTTPYDPGILPVHVVNADDIGKATRVEEVEPEHFTCATFTISQGAAGQVTSSQEQGMAQILAHDPQRKDASILSIDSPIIVCHSSQQASNANNLTPLSPAPEGAYLPAGASLSVTGTGPLWIVATVATVSRVSVVMNRRGSS